MAEININYESGALLVGGSTSASWVNIAEIPFTESKINKNDWTTKAYTSNTYNYGLLIKKDPIVIESNSLLIENTPVLYSFNNNLERVNGVHSNYSIKFFAYPCYDIYYANYYISESTLKEMAGIENDKPFRRILDLYPSNSSMHIPSYGLTTVLGSGLECIRSTNTNDSYRQYFNPAAYDIDINSLGINLPSNAERGINEETLQLFDKNNAIDYRDQRLLNKAEEISYYYNPDRLLAFYNKDGENILLRTSIRYIIQLWENTNTTNALKAEKCMPYAFSNIICGNFTAYDYTIILMGVKKVEEV